MFPFYGSFGIWVKLPWVIHSSILASFRHLLSWRANLPRMDVNFFKNRTHTCHHGLAFFSSVYFWMLLWAIPCVYPPQVYLWDLVTFLSYWLFSVLSVSIFYSKIDFLSWFLFKFVFFTYLPVEFFRYFGISCFLSIGWLCPGIS